MARDRKVPDFSPEELDQIDSVKRNVLNSYAPAPTPVIRGGGGMNAPVHPIAPPMRGKPPLTPEEQQKLGVRFQHGGLIKGKTKSIPAGHRSWRR